MGRRSINTTKSGKYMNPTDQARKEARKKELKKNKKQRQMVRAAVLKMKDPTQILEELEKIDDMEYNVLQPSPLNEKVLKEKRKKLRETLDRVLKMYDKDDPERWVELKRQEMEYEKRRAQLISYYESVKHAQSVQVDDIPLPTLQIPDNIIYGNLPSQIPLPMDLNPLTVPMPPMIMKPVGILKKETAYKEIPAGLEPPGVPSGPPPSLTKLFEEESFDKSGERPSKRSKSLRFSDFEKEGKIILDNDKLLGDDAIDSETAAVPEDQSSAPKPTSLQRRMLALSGQNIDSFMKEMEEVHKKREKERSADLTARLSALDKNDGTADSDDSGSDDEPNETRESAVAAATASLPMGPPGTESIGPIVQQMAMVFRPPPLRMPGPPPLRMPPGPPPGRPLGPPGPPPGLPPRLLRLPPGPPPGAPRLLRPVGPPPPATMPTPTPVPVLSAGPQLINRDGARGGGATIEAKPQIRNLSADVTRFVPSALRVKREDKKTKPGAKLPHVNSQKLPDSGRKQGSAPPTKDDAYMQFMQEMQGLL